MKAVVFVDCQNDFVTGALRNEKAIEVMPKIVEFAQKCVDECDLIYATQDAHTENYLNTLEGKKLPVKHCIFGTEGWQIVDELAEVLPFNCQYIQKPTFGSDALCDIIAKESPCPDEIIICGFVTSICVLANAVMLRAKFPNTPITVLKDLCAGVTEEDHSAALKVLEMQQIDVR